MRVTVDIPDDLALEVEQRAGDRTWSELVVGALVYALANVDTEPHDQPSDDSDMNHHIRGHLDDQGWHASCRFSSPN